MLYGQWPIYNLRACRLAISGKGSPQNRDARVQVVNSSDVVGITAYGLTWVQGLCRTSIIVPLWFRTNSEYSLMFSWGNLNYFWIVCRTSFTIIYVIVTAILYLFRIYYVFVTLPIPFISLYLETRMMRRYWWIELCHVMLHFTC